MTEKQHFIFEPYIGHPEPTLITEAQYEQFCRAADFVFGVNDVNVKFEIIFLCFKEIEHLNFEMVFDWYLGRAASNVDFQDLYAPFNKVLCNFLSAARMYRDQCDKKISEIEFPASALSANIKFFVSSVYDSSFEYRLAESLRNAAQHSNLPVKGLTFGSRVVKTDIFDRAVEYSLDPLLKFDELKNNKRINSNFRRELCSVQKDGIDMKYFSRKYFSDLIRVHKKFKEMVDKEFFNSISTLRLDARNLVSNINNVNILSLGCDDGEDLKACRHIGEEILRNAEHHWAKLAFLGDMTHRHYSSEVIRRKNVIP